MKTLYEPARVLVVDPADDAKTLLLDRLRERPHAAAGSPLALEVLVDDCDRKALVELHKFLPTSQDVFPGLLLSPGLM